MYEFEIAARGEWQVVLIGEHRTGRTSFPPSAQISQSDSFGEHGFRAVMCEADWPDSFRVHRYVTGRGDDGSAADALSDFRRFSAWMWRNTVVVDFVEFERQFADANVRN